MDPEGRMPLVEHLRELRKRLTRAVLGIVLGALLAALFYHQLFELVTGPFTTIKDEYKHKGGEVTLNFGGIGDPFSYALKICAMAGIFVASPVWMYQLWAFVAPGLHKNERRWGVGFVLVSVPLFVGGAVLAYVFLPKGFDLLIGFNPDPRNVSNIISLDSYLSFVLRMFLVFGLAFVMPVFLVALNLVGVVSGRALFKAWRPAILGAFVFAAVATPSGDPWTMTALAVPMLVLFATAASLCLVMDRRRRRAGVDGVDYDELDDDAASPLAAAPLDDPPLADPPLDDRPSLDDRQPLDPPEAPLPSRPSDNDDIT
ncbi:MAG: sec-independent protein translocase protein TatC [Actinomycetota bacterium]|nr:sec-independent protein translocase protein TatC [Actinomycetota bacterium]